MWPEVARPYLLVVLVLRGGKECCVPPWQALRAEADTLQRTVAGQQQAAARHDAQLAAARQELQQLQDEHEETRRDLERLRTTAQEEERRAQEAQVRRLQEEHGVEAAAEARKSHEHELLQQQVRRCVQAQRIYRYWTCLDVWMCMAYLAALPPSDSILCSSAWC